MRSERGRDERRENVCHKCVSRIQNFVLHVCSWSLTWRVCVRAQLIAVEKLRSPLPLELLLYRLQNERDRERWRNEEWREKESVTHAKRWDSFRLLWFSDAVIRAKLNIRSRLPHASVCVGVHFNVWRSWDILQWRLREDAWAAGTVNPVMRGGSPRVLHSH